MIVVLTKRHAVNTDAIGSVELSNLDGGKLMIKNRSGAALIVLVKQEALDGMAALQRFVESGPPHKWGKS